MVGAVMVLVGLLAFVTFVVFALRHAWVVRHAAVRRQHTAIALSFAIGALAEAQNGWVDVDGDGMLDGFVNGSYDWVDLNGGDWLRGGWGDGRCFPRTRRGGQPPPQQWGMAGECEGSVAEGRVG